MTFEEYFKKATGGQSPYPYQREFAEGESISQLLSVPTGVGKTATAILGWLWKRQERPETTPRRLVYCLPMRTLVEQTRDCAVLWLDRLNQFSGQVKYTDETKRRIDSYVIDLDSPIDHVGVHLLMGGEDGERWNEHPERDAIIIGTQDMLISRILNRGYGMSRYRWPVDFSLLNNDSLWVMDETQLMGVGLTTSCQMAAFRKTMKTFGNCHTLWMSATLDNNALGTVDHPKPNPESAGLGLTDDDRRHDPVRKLLTASKPLLKAATQLNAETEKKGYEAALADEILAQHSKGSLTLAVLNSVKRARDVFAELEKRAAKQGGSPELELIHSRFRPAERTEIQARALNEATIASDGPGRIIVATQAIEAGVDISARVLFTELAPWPSLVQRFGRCNRRGVYGVDGELEAAIFWIDIDSSDTKKSILRLPYEWDSLDRARAELRSLTDVGPQSLAKVTVDEPRPLVHVLRRKDLVDLFDTTSDLSGNDLDVSRYIRDAEDCDVQVYWREWDLKKSTKPPLPTRRGDDSVEFFPAANRSELCSVSIGKAREFIDKLKQKCAFRWDPLVKEWRTVDKSSVRPGMVILLHDSAGGYKGTLGWTGDAKDRPPTIELERPSPEDAYDDDDLKGREEPVELTRHLQLVAEQAEKIQESLAELDADIPWSDVVISAWWHDVGKAHVAFQMAMSDGDKVRAVDADGAKLWAKSGDSAMPRYRVPVPITELLEVASQVIENDIDQLTNELAPEPQPVESEDHLTTLSDFDGMNHEHSDMEVAVLDSPAPTSVTASTSITAVAAEKQPRDISRRGFRHELASALAWLEHHRLTTPTEANTDAAHQRSVNLVAYLIAAHHGKVRLSIRSMPNEKRPSNPDAKFARGIWEGDALPAVDLGSGQCSSAVESISLELMNLGESVTQGESWLARTLALRDHYGPFRLAFLETLLRVADWRGSRLGNGTDPDANRASSEV